MLVARLQHPDCISVIHVDRRAPTAPFRQATANTRLVSFVPDAEREAVHWAGFSMVEATFAAIRHALVVAPQTQRFVLLSGSDYPVYPVDRILERLSGTQELIRVDRKLDPAGDGWFDSCASRVFLGDRSFLNPRTSGGLIKTSVRKMEKRFKRRTPYGRAVFYGPSWWSLTRGAIDYMLELHQREPASVDWFRWSRSPDEMVFQTLLKASPLAGNISHDATRMDTTSWPPHLAGVHYAHFENGAASPRTLVLDDLGRLRSSGALFARKVDVHHSKSLLHALDQASRPTV
jgi:hypothetical protein